MARIVAQGLARSRRATTLHFLPSSLGAFAKPVPSCFDGCMSVWRFIVVSVLALLGAATAMAAAPAGAGASPPAVVLLRLEGAVSPASADYVVRGLQDAQQRGAQAVVLELDTPGGLSDAMRDIVKAILGARVPVIGYVAPSGARAASAGTYILYACGIAAMAPATNIGAATPIALIGGNDAPPPRAPASGASSTEPAPASTEMRKATNDAVAYIRALAERRGRNADWAEQAVRAAVSISADQALKLHVIDLIAPDVSTLLADVDGRSVETAAGTQVLHTRGATVEAIEPDARNRFLAVIANPSVALILLLLGFGGLVMEGAHPGGIVPGVVGAICLLLALYALQLLPVNFAGLGLMLLGVVLIVSEAFVPAYGVLGIGGVISFVIGSVVLLRTSAPAYGLALPVVAGIAIAGAGAMAGIVWLALRSRGHPVVSGREQMIGATAEVVADFEGRGLVHLHGERWQAQCAVPLKRGQTVRVTGLRGLVLDVQPAPPAPPKEQMP